MKLVKGLSLACILAIGINIVTADSFTNEHAMPEQFQISNISTGSNYTLLPSRLNSATCTKVKEWEFNIHDIFHYDWLENAMLMTNGE